MTSLLLINSPDHKSQRRVSRISMGARKARLLAACTAVTSPARRHRLEAQWLSSSLFQFSLVTSSDQGLQRNRREHSWWRPWFFRNSAKVYRLTPRHHDVWLLIRTLGRTPNVPKPLPPRQSSPYEWQGASKLVNEKPNCHAWIHKEIRALFPTKSIHMCQSIWSYKFNLMNQIFT